MRERFLKRCEVLYRTFSKHREAPDLIQDKNLHHDSAGNCLDCPDLIGEIEYCGDQCEKVVQYLKEVLSCETPLNNYDLYF